MADKNAVFLTRHIGNTTYKVRVYLSETAEETMEDKILRLIRNDGLANQPECGIMELPQMSVRLKGAPDMANRQTEEKSLRSMSACPVTMTSRATRTPF